MPPKPIIDLETIDVDGCLFDIEAIRERNAQRFELEMLDRIVHLDPEAGTSAAVKEVGEDEFWVRGHFPDRPIMPGILMIEASGQLCSFHCCEVRSVDEIIGFAACEEARFRGTVAPGDTLLIVGAGSELPTTRGVLARSFDSSYCPASLSTSAMTQT